MRITLDGVVAEVQPTSINWSTPRQFGHDGIGRPAYGPYRTCSLAFERMIVPQFHQWWDASQDGESHQVQLPHPAREGIFETYTCYVSDFAPRVNTQDICVSANSGVDILLTRIEVT